MFQKFTMTAAAFIFLFISIGHGMPLYGNDMMMPQIPREVTAEDNALAWTVPAGWKEMPASGMRLGTFVSAEQPDAIDVSIILLGPAAGALEANLERWAGQINAPADAPAIKKIIESSSMVKTGLGQEVKVFDFGLLQSGQEASAKSLAAAIISLDKATVFIKMTGTIGSLAKNRDSFKALVASIHRK